MSFDINSLVRPHLFNLKPYSSARDEYKGSEGIFLDANENPFGSVSGNTEHNRYPDPMQWEIKHKLSAIKAVTPEQIFLGNGSDEPIDLLIRICCQPGIDNIIQTPPTYGMYQVAADVNDVKVINVPLTPDFQINQTAVLEAITPNTKIIFLCSPNNPTGNLLQKDVIETIINAFHGLVVVDEAYIDFADSESFISSLSKYPNLVVLQTFSKAWGMANLRVGMAFASPEILHYLNKVKYPYNINGESQKAVLEALNDEARKNRLVITLNRLKAELVERLSAHEFVQKIYPSDANFLLVKFTKASELFHFLIEQKIIVRDRSKVILCDECLRITIGNSAEIDELYTKIVEFYAI